MKSKVMLFSRTPLQPPKFEDVERRLVGVLQRTSDSLATLKHLPLEAVSTAQMNCFTLLSHRLSPAYEELNAPSPDSRRSESEAEVLRQFSAEQPAVIPLSDRISFRSSLEQLNSRLTGNSSEWRTGWSGLTPDNAGNRIRFPHVSAVPRQLDVIKELMVSDERTPALLKAIVVLSLLVNCHPFTDGNGRVARVLFNSLLRRAGMPSDVYFPFYEIAARSRGGYVIALRQAELHGDWIPIARWVVEAVCCYRKLGGET